MEFEQLLKLIQTVSDSSLTEFSLEEGDLKLNIKTNKEVKISNISSVEPSLPVSIPQGVTVTSAGDFEEKHTQVITGDFKEITSPLVGTFYQASSPEQEAFVKVGDQVQKGQVLGIIEAMKLMNEIEAECDGVIKEILVKNEDMVEYGQPLFRIG